VIHFYKGIKIFGIAIFWLLLLFPAYNSTAQILSDTLEVVDVQSRNIHNKDERDEFTAGQRSQTIEARYKNFYQTHSLANLLAQQTPAFIKSYGVNSMATLSLRGASAAQSMVLWNGVPIQNPAVGMADVSLLGSNLFDFVQIRYGSSSALYGSGNVGGALLVGDAEADFIPTKNMMVTLGLGSYAKKDIAAQGQFQNRKLSIKAKVFLQHADNNFEFRDNNDSLQKMQHAHLTAMGALIAMDYNLASKEQLPHILFARFWWQRYNRQIPAALFESSSQKEQDDQSFRSLIGWRKQFSSRTTAYLKTSFNKDFIQYRDGLVLPDNKNVMFQYYHELGLKYQLPVLQSKSFQHQIIIFAPFQYTGINGQNMPHKPTQTRPALAAAYSFNAFNQKLQFNTAIRQEWINNVATPFLPGAGLQASVFCFQQSKWDLNFLIRANAQKTYRIPSLNELYFFPGGNEQLKPEQGWSIDGGYSVDLSRINTQADMSTKKWSLHHDLSVFSRHIQDWIYWMGGAIWTPHNIASVHSRGVETDNKLELNLGKLKLISSLRTAYVLATATDSYIPGDNSIGKQIPYMPRYNGQVNIGVEWKDLFLNYNHTHTGYRFVTTDESQYLAPYQTGNIQLLYSLIIKNYLIRISGQVFNCWNNRYNVVWERPMPGRNYSLTLCWTING
jgi:vitamin B12 transporter